MSEEIELSAQERLKLAEPEFRKKWSEKNLKEKKEKQDKELYWMFWDAKDSDEQAKSILIKFPMYYDENKKWWWYNEEICTWEICTENFVLGNVKKFYKIPSYNKVKYRSEIINALKDESALNPPKKVDRFELQIGKYIYNIRTGDKYPCTYKIKSNIYIPHNIDLVKEGEFPEKLISIFKQWVDDEFDVLIDIIAFMMSPVYFLDIAFWIHGEGENGKGLFQTVLKNVLGYQNMTAQDIELLSDPKDRFTKGFLKDKLCCSLGDGNFGVLKETKGIKMLAGCTDLIRGEKKGGDQFDFENKAKLIGSYNTIPQTLDKTKGFYRRNHCTHFPHDFSGKKNPLPEVDMWEYTVLTKICFDRLLEMYKNNEIKGWFETWEERRDYWEYHSDPVRAFIEQNMEEDMDYYFFGKKFYKEYQKWAIKNGKNQFNTQMVEAMLQNNGYEKKRKDVYHIDGYCWGKKKTIPEEYDYNELGFDKYNVFCGLKFKNRHNRQKRHQNQIKSSYVEEANRKKASITSKTSKIRNPMHDIILEAIQIYESVDIFTLMKYTESNYPHEVMPHVEYLCKVGEIYESSKGVWRLK